MSIKHLLGLEHLPVETITKILDTAGPMKQIISRDLKKVPTLRGKAVATVFYEPSTRTRLSFELAAKYLSADTVGLATASSSVVKGETLIDTARTVAAMGVDVIVLRHPMSGAAELMTRYTDAYVVNAGDGMHEHPTQALLDMFTILESKNRISGLKVAILGDILHSRVARSNIWGLTKLGAEVHVAGPPTMLPAGLEQLGVRVYDRPEAALEGADVVMALRLQLERQRQGLIPSLREYARLYGLNAERLALTKDDAVVLHPGPMNRGVEITAEVADGSRSLITDQVTNGVAVRMACLYLMTVGDASREDID
ncbi:MAG: aspartate carbamoyltransferase catalytic subunit [Eubacteriales bacterium]|nr:aspartate carbamoyltransferase catalytic subunit [Bacillota bacterium]MBV1727395.1 aspartate carbamoyltransferase catalytic subunit [Desulforudis sp.]MDQ7789574.1 aspartate carbamoyltransferase catalytic subunit [Clostridia bacterium]MDZ4043714.1 aspartate carbamoyltransferase catalytic subunit [Eubacteriales bacterium]MBU4532869.1 aspartate carbamoyltransferase catalytic subunit [Bacillota bacterium]